MSGPKHLWSGNWERESEHAAEQRPERLPMPEPEQPQPEPPAPRQKRGVPARYAWAAAAFVLVLVVGIALASTLGGSSNKPKPHTTTVRSARPTTTTNNSSGGAALQQPTTTTTPAGTGPTATWLGMEIVTGPSGAAVSALQLGSVADQAGFEPGDVITSINSHQINTVPQLAAATAGMRMGGTVNVEVLRNSSYVLLSAVPLKGRPTIHR